MNSAQVKILVLFIIIVIDSLTTTFLISANIMGEANPFMNWVIQKSNVVWMAMSKIAFSLILLLSIIKCDAVEKHITWAIPAYLVILIGGLAIQSIL